MNIDEAHWINIQGNWYFVSGPKHWMCNTRLQFMRDQRDDLRGIDQQLVAISLRLA